MLCLPKTEPSAGRKGFLCGNVFFPLAGKTPSQDQRGICIRNDQGNFFLPLEEMPPPSGSLYEKSSAEMPADGLILHLPLAQSAETDELGNAISETGNVLFTELDGLPCAYFDGASDIEIPSIASGPGGINPPFSVSFWFYVEKGVSGGIFHYSYGSADVNLSGVYILTGAEFPVEGFHHFAFVYDGSESRKLIDGRLIAKDSGSYTFVYPNCLLGAILYREIQIEM